MDEWGMIGRERSALADQLADLTDAEWATPSLCDAWTVRDVLAHLLAPLTPSVQRRFLLAMVKARGSFDRANRDMTAQQARVSTTALLDGMRDHADSRFHPPGMGPGAPLTDLLVHGLDIRIPLGLDTDRPPEAWRAGLGFLVSSKATRGFVRRPLPAVTLVATDIEFRAPLGSGGPEARGTAPALALAVLRRQPWLDRLEGQGAATLQEWAAQP